jgi:hypothetical protein
MAAQAAIHAKPMHARRRPRIAVVPELHMCTG